MTRTMLAVLILLLCAGGGVATVAADDANLPPASYPPLRQHGLSVEAFIPNEWRIERQLSGDLNGDGHPDSVLVLRELDDKKIMDSGNASAPQFDTNPRILAVLFADGRGGYDLALENHTLIARTTIPGQQDPLDPDGVQPGEVVIRNGTLRVTLGYFSGDMGRATFTFRFQSKRFELIGYDRANVTRSSGVMTDISVNYSTRRMERKVGSISDDAQKVARSRLPAKPLLTLEQIGDGLAFDPAP